MTRAERAEALHAGGSACSQAVFSVFAEELGLPEAAAHRLATGLGGGIGRMGLSCGALTGGVLALSLAFGSETGADQERKLDTYARVGEFMAESGAAQGSTDCRALLGGIDMRTQEGRERMKAEGLSAKVCNPLIRETVEKIERILVAEGKIRPLAPRASCASCAPDTAVAGQAAAAAPAAPADRAPHIRIERARPADSGTLAEFRYRMFADMMPDTDWSARREVLLREAGRYYREKADSADQLNFVAYVDDKPAGSACAVIEERPLHVRYEGTRYGYVHNVYVLPEYRGLGLARALMNRLHEEAARAGIVRLGLHASRFGRALYLGLGYEPVERYMEKENLR